MPAPQRIRALALGALVVGTLDILDALIFFGLRGARPIRIFQSIAAGLFGRSAFQGGVGTALLGGALHFFIAFVIVAVYFVASRRAPVLTRHAVPLGVVYGIAVYLVMNYIVIPLSAATPSPFAIPIFINGILIHAFGVGLPAAVSARAAAPSDARGPRTAGTAELPE